MLPYPDPNDMPPDPETQAFRRLRFERWMDISADLPRAGIVTVFGPSGYDKTRFCRLLLTETWVENAHAAYVSVSTLERTPMALMRAIAVALQIPVTQQLPTLLKRFGDLDNVVPSVISAAREHLQDPALSRHLLILDDLDSMTEEMTATLSNVLLRTMGIVTPRIVLSGRRTKLGLRNAGVPITMITEEHLALSETELTAMGMTNPELRGWPLAVRLALSAMSDSAEGAPPEPPHALIERLLERVETGLLSSLEAASISPDWPLSVPVMRALQVDQDFVQKALSVGLPVLAQPNDRFQPHPLLQQVLQKRLEADPVRLVALSAAYARATDVDTGRQLEALMSLSQGLAEARLAEIVKALSSEDMGDWASAHMSVLWRLYGAGKLTRETGLAVHLARALGESGRVKDEIGRAHV